MDPSGRWERLSPPLPININGYTAMFSEFFVVFGRCAEICDACSKPSPGLLPGEARMRWLFDVTVNRSPNRWAARSIVKVLNRA